MEKIAITWAQRAQAELGAQKRFFHLGEQLFDLKAHPMVVAMAERAQEDERRHAIMCAQVAREYGHKSGFEDLGNHSVFTQKKWEQRKSPEEKLLCEVVLMCCITETINASLLNSIYGESKNSATQRVIHQILKDETKHSQIGWAHLSFETKKRDCRFLSNYLEDMMKISARDELFLPVANDLGDENSFHYGVMPMGLRLDQFKETLFKIVFPGFKKFGIDTCSAEAWIKKKEING